MGGRYPCCTAQCCKALSPAFAVQRGVAQGCPLSPLLYAIFVEPVLQDMQGLSHLDLLWVVPAATRRKLVGQAYADDLAGIAATQQGLQRVVQAVHLHSLRWGWLLDVPKSVFMSCPPLCAGVLSPMPAWVWRDVRSFRFHSFVFVRRVKGGGATAIQAS